MASILPSTLSFSSDQQSPALSHRIYELLSQRQTSFEEVLTLLRKQDLEKAEETERLRALAAARCPICTLPVPCRHFDSQKAAYRWKKPTETKVDQSLDNLSKESLPTDGGKKTYRIRYRSANDISYSYSDRSHSLHVPHRHYNRQFKLMERLDHYREEKYRLEIEKIEEQMKREKQIQREIERKEQERRKRDAQLKASLARHREALRQAEQQRVAAYAQAAADLQKATERKSRYLKKQVRD